MDTLLMTTKGNGLISDSIRRDAMDPLDLLIDAEEKTNGNKMEESFFREIGMGFEEFGVIEMDGEAALAT